jgi:hypothetical protein
MIFAGITTTPADPPAEPPADPQPAEGRQGKRKRARTAAGTFQADDSATPDVNEAFTEA